MANPMATPRAAPITRPGSQCLFFPVTISSRVTVSRGSRSWLGPSGGAPSGTSAIVPESAPASTPLIQSPGAACVRTRTRAPTGSSSAGGSGGAWARASAASEAEKRGEEPGPCSHFVPPLPEGTASGGPGVARWDGFATVTGRADPHLRHRPERVAAEVRGPVGTADGYGCSPGSRGRRVTA